MFNMMKMKLKNLKKVWKFIKNPFLMSSNKKEIQILCILGGVGNG